MAKILVWHKPIMSNCTVLDGPLHLFTQFTFKPFLPNSSELYFLSQQCISTINVWEKKKNRKQEPQSRWCRQKVVCVTTQIILSPKATLVCTHFRKAWCLRRSSKPRTQISLLQTYEDFLHYRLLSKCVFPFLYYKREYLAGITNGFFSSCGRL